MQSAFSIWIQATMYTRVLRATEKYLIHRESYQRNSLIGSLNKFMNERILQEHFTTWKDLITRNQWDRVTRQARRLEKTHLYQMSCFSRENQLYEYFQKWVHQVPVLTSKEDNRKTITGALDRAKKTRAILGLLKRCEIRRLRQTFIRWIFFRRDSLRNRKFDKIVIGRKNLSSTFWAFHCWSSETWNDLGYRTSIKSEVKNEVLNIILKDARREGKKRSRRHTEQKQI